MRQQLTSIPEATGPMLDHIKKFHIVLIKPSKYDDDGYVIRFWKGVLPSNTLNVLHGLTEDIKTAARFRQPADRGHHFRRNRRKSAGRQKLSAGAKRRAPNCWCAWSASKPINFPAPWTWQDSFRAEGITVIIGGFHTSGTINMLSDQEPDIQELYREGICIVSGEVEGKWEGILADYLHGRLKPLYSFAQDLQNLVDIEDAPLPQTSPKTMGHFAYPSFATADTSRGCPFACTFCTIINVQGRKMRERSPREHRRA